MNENAEPLKKKRILILAPFFGRENTWIDDFCDRPDFEFIKVPHLNRTLSWHKRGPTTPSGEWLEHFKYSFEAMKWKSECIVTCFPQLTLTTAGLLPLTGKSRTRLVAWDFNLGSLPRGWKGLLARRVFQRVDRFVVHARGEIGNYARWLGVDEEKFRFVPLQRGKIANLKPSPLPAPYIVSMGSANRDYSTLIDAVLGTGIKTVIISKKSEIDCLPEHPDLVKLTDLTWEECDSILSGAKLNVVPIANNQTASGQVSFTTSLRMGVPTIVTNSISTIDYIRDGETGLLVPPGDAAALRQAIESIWRNEALGSRIGLAGRNYADEYLSDQAAAKNLATVIDELFTGDRDWRQS
jgi:glycosyltransferase involved in cell wall biosynthesis